MGETCGRGNFSWLPLDRPSGVEPGALPGPVRHASIVSACCFVEGSTLLSAAHG
jgi:hypothetical protein